MQETIYIKAVAVSKMEDVWEILDKPASYCNFSKTARITTY